MATSNIARRFQEPSESVVMSRKAHFNVGTWSPFDAGRFLEDHDFKMKSKIGGNDCYWKGPRPDRFIVIVWYPLMRKQLADTTMRVSVMRKSGYPKTHWDLWRSLSKSSQQARECCVV